MRRTVSRPHTGLERGLIARRPLIQKQKQQRAAALHAML
jgi:hypothetical protein